MNIYLIQSISESELFWDGYGWVELYDGAAVYTTEERKNLCLPVDGEWVEFKKTT